jgi:hypothetical protein
MKGTRLPVTESGVAARAASPTLGRVSRYPTRTAPAVPGHGYTHLWSSPATTSPPLPAGELRPPTGPGHLSGCAWPRWKLGRQTRTAWPLPRSSVGEADGIGRDS